LTVSLVSIIPSLCIDLFAESTEDTTVKFLIKLSFGKQTHRHAKKEKIATKQQHALVPVSIVVVAVVVLVASFCIG